MNFKLLVLLGFLDGDNRVFGIDNFAGCFLLAWSNTGLVSEIHTAFA